MKFLFYVAVSSGAPLECLLSLDNATYSAVNNEVKADSKGVGGDSEREYDFIPEDYTMPVKVNDVLYLHHLPSAKTHCIPLNLKFLRI